MAPSKQFPTTEFESRLGDKPHLTMTELAPKPKKFQHRFIKLKI